MLAYGAKNPVAIFKFCQYLLKATSPNLILSKLSHYMVHN